VVSRETVEFPPRLLRKPGNPGLFLGATIFPFASPFLLDLGGGFAWGVFP